jgi:PAS domain S-box-containing protein
MMTTPTTNDELLEENEQLRLRLEEAEAVVEAIRNGIVDAVVVHSTPGESVYTLEGADRPYRLLVEAMQQGVAVLSPEGVLLYCNPCLADLFQMSVEKVTGCTLDGFVAESDYAMLTDLLSNVEYTSAQREVRLCRQDGTTFPAALVLSALSNAVHLLRLQKNEDKLQHQARTIIERQVVQLTRLVDDLLEVSRISTGTINLQLERIALYGVVECAVDTVRPLMTQRKHELTVSPLLHPIWLYADAARLEQVVVNLLTNAAKYTADGGHIVLAVQQEGDEAVLRVRDTGIGISPELLPRIFDLFTQAERSLDRAQGGLGIGLCLVQRLVEMHGGKVQVFSVLGQGSEFIVRLPVTIIPAPQPPSTHQEAAEPTGPGLRVLVVDDNVDAATSLVTLLEASGHDVRAAHDGPTSLEAAQGFRPDVVLLDIGLPGLDGFEVAKWLRKQPILSNAVLVAMTGYGQKSDRQRSHEAGFDHHLVKPVDFGKVEQILATIPGKVT